MAFVTRMRRALAPRSGRIQLGALDLSSAGAWDSTAAVAVTEVAPAVNVPRRSALAEVVLQPGVARVPRDDSPSYTAPAAQLLRIEGGQVETRMCIPFSREFGVVRGSIRKTRTIMEKHGYLFADDIGELAVPARPLRFVRRPALHLALPFKDNYFHWLIESLGKLLMTRHLLPRDVVLAVRPGASAAFIREICSMVGADDLLYVLPQRHVVAFPALYVPPQIVTHQYLADPAPTSPSALTATDAGGRLGTAPLATRDRSLDFRLHPSAVNAVRALAPTVADRRRRLYVARKTRGPTNHREVLATLERYGFSEVVAEDLHVKEQMELFAQAEVVVGAQGAGLANTVFCHAGTTIVDLQSTQLDQGEMNVYWNLAAVCDLRYVRIVCRALEPAKRSDFYVDCRNLEEVLRRQVPSLR